MERRNDSGFCMRVLAWIPSTCLRNLDCCDEEMPFDPSAEYNVRSNEAHERLDMEIAKNASMQEQLVKTRMRQGALTQELTTAKEELRVERGNSSRLQADLQHARETHSAELRKAKVLLSRERQDLVEVKAELDRYKEVAQKRNSDALLLRGVNIQARFPTLPEINASIRCTLKGIVREWVYEMSTTYLEPSIDLPFLLGQVFLRCQALVMHHHLRYTAFFHGQSSTGEGGRSDDMEEEAANFMLKHMRRHHSTLYPLTPGGDLDNACCQVIHELADVLGQRHNIHQRRVLNYLSVTGVESVIKEYLTILVGVTLHPLAAFSDDCGRVDAFNKKIHYNSIDGDAVRPGGECVVVFPGLRGELETGQGPRTIGKKYILPIMQKPSAEIVDMDP